MKSTHLALIALFILIVFSYFHVFLEDEYKRYLMEEDSWIENVGALAFLTASLCFSYCFIRSKTGTAKSRNIFFLLLALLFFFAFGEEISWGQRIFNWQTPEQLAAVNYQKETNIHNLDFFVNKSSVDNSQGPLSFLLVTNMGRLFFYFWFSFLIIIPVIDKFSVPSGAWFRKIRLPIAPMWAGGLMILNLILSILFFKLRSEDPIAFESIDELKETNYAVIIACLAFYWVKKKN